MPISIDNVSTLLYAPDVKGIFRRLGDQGPAVELLSLLPILIVLWRSCQPSA